MELTRNVTRDTFQEAYKLVRIQILYVTNLTDQWDTKDLDEVDGLMQ